MNYRHFAGDKFVQETMIGYKYGSFSKLGIVCERTDPSLYPNQEEVKQEEEPMEVDETSEPAAQ